MGKTVPSYRYALEDEIAKWRGFRDALPSEEEKKAFDELMDMCRAYATAGSNATNPIIFEPMLMSIALAHQKIINDIEKKLSCLRLQLGIETHG
jgi:hypothetical protein